MKNLLSEVNADLKNSDATDAGATDIEKKITKSDVGFSMMRNTINAEGEVTGSDVADYLERAAELNDEIDTVPFGLETDDGQIVKVYVNAEQAEKFEEAMKKMLGLEDDIENAINELAQEFDIVDVVWPTDVNGIQNVEAEETEEDFDELQDEDFDELEDDEEMTEIARHNDVKETINKGDDMTIGKQFLARLAEGKKADEGFKFDAATEAMKRQLRDIGGEKNFADKIAEVGAMVGIQGRFMNTPAGREAVLNGASELRSKPAAVASFLALHSVLSSFHGVQPVQEKKSEEDDLAGPAFQKFVEEILVSLGIPETLVSVEAKAGVRAPMKRTIAELAQNAEVKGAFKVLGQKLGIRMNDGVIGKKKLGEAKAAQTGAEQGGAEQEVNIKDVLLASKVITTALGIDMADETVLRVVNAGALNRSVKNAMRDGKTKRAVQAFLRVYNQGN